MELRAAFELFLADQPRDCLRPSELLEVFERMGLDADYASATDMLRFMVENQGDEFMTFDRFMKSANDYFNERNTREGIERIYRLFDNEKTGRITKQDIERISGDLDMFFRSE